MTILPSLLVCLAAAIAAEPIELPAPTGSFPMGRVSFHWQDSAREELETAAEGDRRELMVHLIYPAAAGAGGERADYVPDAEDMRGPWNAEQLDRVRAVRAHSIENAPLPQGDARFPLAVFSPGGGAKGLTYHALLEDLASHGWIVAAIDPPYNAPAVRLPDGRVLGKLSEVQKGWPKPKNDADFERSYIERVAHWARDIRFVIDQIEKLNADDARFANRIDLAAGVGAFGHSRGGQAAAAVRIIDQRIRGGINLDGTTPHAVLPIEGPGKAGEQPFLWIQKQIPPPPSEEQLKRAGRTMAEYEAQVEKILGGWRQTLETIDGGALRVTFDRREIDHMDFSDEPYWFGNMSEESRPSALKTIADTRQWVRAFFDATVRGQWADLRKLASVDPSSGMTVHTHGNLLP